MTVADPAIRIASTILLLREAPELQVLMVRRHREIDFMSDAMVFPGGKVEPQDRDAAWAGRVLGWDETPEAERGPRIAAIREAFEESGLLLGGPEGSGPATLPERAAVESGEVGFLDYVGQHGAAPDLRTLTLFSRWLTPPIMPKRFDTFFYLAPAPAGQIAVSDGRETVEAEWIAPGEALRLAARGERNIVFPTRMNLRLLAATATSAAAVEAAGRRPAATVSPRVETRGSERYLVLEREAGYGAVDERLDIG